MHMVRQLVRELSRTNAQVYITTGKWCLRNCDGLLTLHPHCRMENQMLSAQIEPQHQRRQWFADAFRDRIYVGENGIPDRVYSCEADSLSHCQVVYSTHGLFRFTDMRVYHSSQQPLNRRKNDCAGAVCSHLCVLTTESFRCLCPNGMVLGSDGRTCERELR